MFKVFNRKKKQVDLLENPISPVIVNELGGIGELTFSVPSTYKHLELEGYIQVENDHEYVIKEIVTHGTNRDVVCMLNIEEILGMAWSKFISRDNTLMKCAELVLSGTRWRAINKSTCNVKRNLYGTVTNSYNLLQMMCTVYNVEFIFDTYNKTVTFVDKVGKDAGVYFINDINLKQLNVDTHTHKYITRVIPIGKDGLTIESVNDGKNYLENKSYSDKNIYGIWQSDKHDDPSALKADAKRFLDEMAIPYETYEVVVDDLYALKGYDEFKYGLGDIVTIIDGDTETRIQQRIIQRTYNLLEPDKDTIHIANKDATFEDYYKRLQTIADMTQSVIGSDGSINGGSISDGTISGDKIENDSINSGHISSGSITSTHIKAEQILADHIMSNQITTNHLVANSITSDHIQANSIDTKHLKANSIVADHIQTGTITAGSGIIAEGAIGSAEISEVDANKLKAGTIDTSRVTISGANSNLKISGNRLQVFQGIGSKQFERVSLGDVNGDGSVYGFRVRGADGETVLLDENGVTKEGITDGSITNSKIAGDANIDGGKINIHSVVTKINEGSTQIQGTRIDIDNKSLDVAIDDIHNVQSGHTETLNKHSADIKANADQIALKVSTQTYEKDKEGNTTKFNNIESQLKVNTDAITSKVSNTTYNEDKKVLEGSISSVSQKADTINSRVTTLDGKYTEIKQTVDSIDVTGKVSFSDLSTAGKTTINGANIDTTNLRVRGELISGQINGVGGIRFADGAVIASYDSHVTGYKGISVSAPSVKLGDKVDIYHPTMYFDVVGKNNTSSATTTWTMSSAGALTCASASLSGTLNVKNGVIYGMNNLALARGSIYIPIFGTSYTYDFIRGGNSSIAFADSGPIHFIYNGSKSSFIAGGTVYLPHAGHVNCDHFRLGAGIMACPSSGSFHFLTANGNTSPLYAGRLYSADVRSASEPMVISNNSAFDKINSVNVIETKNGLNLHNPISTTNDIDESPDVVKTVYNEEKDEIKTSIDYTSAISTLWKAVQELKSEVDSLKQENNELKLLLNKGE